MSGWVEIFQFLPFYTYIHLTHLVPLLRCDITRLSWHLIWRKKKEVLGQLCQRYNIFMKIILN